MIPWKKISHLTGSVALLAALVSATSGEVAYAADTGVALQSLKLATCPTGDVCVWEQQNYQGRRWNMMQPLNGSPGPKEGGPAPCLTPPFVARSLRNATPHQVVQIFEGSECRGRILAISRPDSLPGAQSDFANLTFRSFQFCAYTEREASKCLQTP